MEINSFAVVLILLGYQTVLPAVAYLPKATNKYCFGPGTFPNPSDPECSSFYKCTGENFQPTLELCPSGFRYSDKTKSCTSKSDVPCNNTTDNHVIRALSKLCTSENQKLSHPDNNCEICNKYLICRKNTAGVFKISSRERFCPSGKIFKPTLGDCDSALYFNCDIDDPYCNFSFYDDRLSPIKNDCASYYSCTGNLLQG